MLKRLFILALAVLFVFSCDLQTPKELHLKKETPELKFSANVESFELEEIFNGQDFDFDYGDDVTVFDCEDMPNLTKLIYIELYKGDLASEPSVEHIVNFITSFGTYNTGPGEPLLVGAPVEMTAPDIQQGFLENFRLKPLQAHLYISGDNDQFVDALLIELTINGNTTEYYRSPACDIPPESFISEIYSGTELPPTIPQNKFELPFDNDLSVNLDISIKPNIDILPEWLTDMNILVELAIWLPFDLIVGTGGAEFPLPFGDLFSDDEDLFGRKSADKDSAIYDAIEDLILEIILDGNPFSGATFVVTSPGSAEPIECFIDGDSIKIHMVKEMLGFPFAPEFLVRFEEGDTLHVPRYFTISELAFKARLKYVVDL